MRVWILSLADEKLARAAEAVFRLAGVPSADDRRSDDNAARILIADEKTAASGRLSDRSDFSAVVVLYRDERWLRSADAVSLAERYGSSFAAVRRPFDFAGLTELFYRLPCRGDASDEAKTDPSAAIFPADPAKRADRENGPDVRAERERPEEDRERREPPVPRLRADPERGTVSLGGKEVRLTEREFALFAYFQDHAGRIVTRKELREAVWHGEADPSANVTDVYVSYLRKKLASLAGDEPGAGSDLLTSVRGKGYLYRDGAR